MRIGCVGPATCVISAKDAAPTELEDARYGEGVAIDMALLAELENGTKCGDRGDRQGAPAGA
jgi:hypothetical protein